MRTYMLLFLSLFMSQLIQAQESFSKIINDPNVVWASEYFIDVNPAADRDQNEALEFKSTSGSILKSVATPAAGTDIFNCNNWQYENSLAKKLFNNLNEMTVYTDHKLSKSFSKEETAKIGSSVDTVITFHPKTFEEIKQVIINEIDLNDIVGFRQYGIVYYDKKEAQFFVKPISLAPIFQPYDTPDIVNNPKYRSTLFWVPLAETNKTNLDDKNIQWVSRILHHLGNDSEIVPKKQLNSFGESWELLVKELNSNYKKRKVYDVFQVLGQEALSAKAVQTLGSSVDTVISFDPKTFEKRVNVVISEINAEDIKEMRIVQDWIWDEKKKQLFVRYLGYAPIIRRYDETGKFLNSGPMFYLRMKGVN